MEAAYITPCQRILGVEDEDDVQLLATWKLPSLGAMAREYDAFTGVRSYLDLRTD
jgi:hypothetical protein